MQRRAKELGYSLLTFDTCRERTQEALIIHICSRYPFPGVVFLYPPENNLLLQQLELAKPVNLNRTVPATDICYSWGYILITIGSISGAIRSFWALISRLFKKKESKEDKR